MPSFTASELLPEAPCCSAAAKAFATISTGSELADELIQSALPVEIASDRRLHPITGCRLRLKPSRGSAGNTTHRFDPNGPAARMNGSCKCFLNAMGVSSCFFSFGSWLEKQKKPFPSVDVCMERHPEDPKRGQSY